MKISTVLDYIDSGDLALPEFQRGYVWNRDQVRGLFESLYRRHPVGGLLVWVTDCKTADRRGDGPVAAGSVRLLLDGQQRMTSLYGVVRGKPPKFFDGNPQTFTGLRFHLADEAFEFYQPIKMRDDPLWIDVTELMRRGTAGLGSFVARLTETPELAERVGEFVGRLSTLLSITDIDLHVEEVTGAEKSLDVVVEIFNRVNSGGTKLSKGDLALAKICADWPDARNQMKAKLQEWEDAGYYFSLDWLLRSVNTVLTGEARFAHLHDRTATEIEDGLARACKQIDASLDLIAGRIGLDHDRVLFGRFGIPVMVRYMESRVEPMGVEESDKLLFWFAEAGMWGRFSSSTETIIDQDLAALEGSEGGLDALIEQLRLWQGGLRVEAGHFDGWSLGARFYPVLYMLTRMGEAKDWGSGLALKAHLLGKMARLEVHHIFPKSRLYDADCDYERAEVNAVANFCFLTKETNLVIGNRFPEEYFTEVETKHPGALASQWIPMDPALWRIERYRDFLEARKALLAAEANRYFASLLHGDARWLSAADSDRETAPTVPGGIDSEAEEAELETLNDWLALRNLPRGHLAFDHADPATGAQTAVFDLAWPDGLQPGLTGPIAVLLNETAEVLAIASAVGYRCFTSTAAFRSYVEAEILRGEAA
ncbi:MAG: DUF262 domain-containing protein [Gammaproteobacteria bacterium]|nr:DUF262 domain-containing protein [Gammaproteobacteria bacterium]MYE30183.1 DUF262 domain-containing protein [Gammaproteobacteria bacterium]